MVKVRSVYNIVNLPSKSYKTGAGITATPPSPATKKRYNMERRITIKITDRITEQTEAEEPEPPGEPFRAGGARGAEKPPPSRRLLGGRRPTLQLARPDNRRAPKKRPGPKAGARPPPPTGAGNSRPTPRRLKRQLPPNPRLHLIIRILPRPPGNPRQQPRHRPARQPPRPLRRHNRRRRRRARPPWQPSQQSS